MSSHHEVCITYDGEICPLLLKREMEVDEHHIYWWDHILTALGGGPGVNHQRLFTKSLLLAISNSTSSTAWTCPCAHVTILTGSHDTLIPEDQGSQPLMSNLFCHHGF